MLFAAAGYDVVMYDILPGRVEEARKDIKDQLASLQEAGLLRGTLSIEEQYNLIRPAQDLKDCVEGAKYVQVYVHFNCLILNKETCCIVN